MLVTRSIDIKCIRWHWQFMVQPITLLSITRWFAHTHSIAFELNIHGMSMDFVKPPFNALKLDLQFVVIVFASKRSKSTSKWDRNWTFVARVQCARCFPLIPWRCSERGWRWESCGVFSCFAFVMINNRKLIGTFGENAHRPKYRNPCGQPTFCIATQCTRALIGLCLPSRGIWTALAIMNLNIFTTAGFANEKKKEQIN